MPTNTAPAIVKGLPPTEIHVQPAPESLSIVGAGLAWQHTFAVTVMTAVNEAMRHYGDGTDGDGVTVTAYEWEGDDMCGVTRVIGIATDIDAQSLTVSGRVIDFDYLASVHLHP